MAEYDALVHSLRLAKEIDIQRIICFGDSDLVVQQVSCKWDARDANIASYRFLVQQLTGSFEGCEFHHVPRADNGAADTMAKIGSTRQAIPAGVSLERLLKPSIKPSPESESIFVPADAAGSPPDLAALPAPSTPAAVPAPSAPTSDAPVVAGSGSMAVMMAIDAPPSCPSLGDWRPCPGGW